MVGSEDEKMKRSEIERYVAPALRDTFNKHFEEKRKHGKDNHTNEAANRQTYSSEYRDSSRRTTNIVPGKVRYSSSGSSNPRNTSDESEKDCDSSDFEECCSVPTETTSGKEPSIKTNEKTSDDHWNNERRGKPSKNNHDIEAENCQTYAKIPNQILKENDSNLESHENQMLHFKSKETKHDKRLFYKSDESSISDIETLIDDHMKIEGRVLTSTPYSDIDEPKVIDAAKFDPEEDGLESTLLSQSETTINTNRNKCDYNFEIYKDPSSVMNQTTDFTKIFGNNYIPPPVPRPAFAFPLPLIHRLPLRDPSPIILSAPGQISSQKRQQSPTQLGNPRSLFPPSLQLHSSVPSFIPTNSTRTPTVARTQLGNPRSLFPPSLQLHSSVPSFIPTNSTRTSTVARYVLSLESFRASNLPYRPSMPPMPSPQERINPSHPLQNASNSPHFYQRGLNAQGLGSNEQEDPFYIPPPVPPPQQMNRVQRIRNLHQRLNVQSRELSSISSVKNILYDGKIWPQNSETRR